MKQWRLLRGSFAAAMAVLLVLPYVRPVTCELDAHHAESMEMGQTAVAPHGPAWSSPDRAEATCHDLMGCGLAHVAPVLDAPRAVPTLPAVGHDAAPPQQSVLSNARAPIPPPPRA